MREGTTLNRTYRILQPIGAGGLGQVYLAYHENLQKYVVVKKIKEGSAGTVNLRIEVDILKSLHHTYLPQVYDFLTLPEGIFTVMEYIPGHDLKYYMERGARFSEEQLVCWMKQLCEVLTYLHSRKPPILHCDIKPGNLMIAEEGNICLIDFNISVDGENNKDLVGLSSHYASPEQLRKAEYKVQGMRHEQVRLGPASDLYSAGAVFCHLISGVRPDAKRTNYLPLKVLLRDVGGPTGYLTEPCSEQLINIVDHCMEESPSRRFSGADRLLEALDHMEKWTARARRRRLYLTVGGVLAVCLTAMIASAAFLISRSAAKADFREAYEAFAESAEAWLESLDEEGADDLLQEGLEILNNSAYQKYLESDTDKEVNLLYTAAATSSVLEDYAQAEEYLEEIIRLEPDDWIYYRDLAVARIHRQKWTLAQDAIDTAESLGMDEAQKSYVEAEIACEKGEYEKVLELAAGGAKSGDSTISMRCADLALLAAQETGEWDACIEFLETCGDGQEESARLFWTRLRGLCCLQAVQAGDESWLDKGISCYEEVKSAGFASEEDLYNLESACEIAGDYARAKEILLELADEEDAAYTAYVRLALLCYRSENEKTAGERSYYAVQKYYKEAKKRYEASGEEGDASMLQLEEIMTQLQEKGLVE